MLSVIVPVYNPGVLLKSCVDSILAQSYRDIEIILVDDGSSDGSEILCDQYQEEHHNVKTVHLKNGGVSNARNKGISLASGEFITFVDSDDWLEKDTFEAAINRMKQDNSSCAIYAMQIDRMYEDRIESKNLSLGRDVVAETRYIAENFVELFYADYLSSSCTKIFKRSIIIENHIQFDSSLVMYEDFSFVLNYLMCSQNVSIMSKTCYHYRMDATINAVSKRRTKNLLLNLDKVVDMIYLFFRRFNVQEGDLENQVIIDLYIIYLHKLFVERFSIRERLKGIHELEKNKNLQDALLGSRSFRSRGRFYSFLAMMLKWRFVLPVYFIYKRRYSNKNVTKER